MVLKQQFFEQTKHKIKDLLNNKKPKIILGLSGGPDSVFLFYVLKELNNEKTLKLIAVHLDHEWRKESKEDSEFCKKLCAKFKIPFFSAKSSNLNLHLKFNGSKEEIGRKQRIYFFEKIRKEQNCDFIATAHHQQDNFETFFLRLIRGSSLSGLTGIKQINDKHYLRPLLNIKKQDILDYLDGNNITYLIDKTNNSDDFLRNRIRKYILPAMLKCDERVNKNFEKTLCNLKEADSFLKKEVKTHFQNIFKLKQQKITGNLELFKKQADLFLQKQLILRWLIKEKVQFRPSRSFIEEILRFLSSDRGGSHTTGVNWEIHKKTNNFWIEARNNQIIGK